MKHLFTIATLLFSMTAFAQVGINNISPKATLDITAKTTDGSKPEGLIAPRLTGNQIQLGTYGSAQLGTIIYATAAATAPNSFTTNITAPGYYYFDGSVWQKMNGAAASDTTNDAWVNDTTNSLVKLGTKADGTARAAGTDFVVKDNGQIGIGTSSPDASAALDVTSTNKGFLPPRVALTGKTDVTTISSPTAGLLVYNTGAGALKSAGMYYWDGSQWTSLKSDGGTSSPTDLNIGETRTSVVTVPSSSFAGGSTGISRTWMYGRLLANTTSVNYKLLSDAAGSTANFVNFGPNGALRMDFSSGGYDGTTIRTPKIVNTSSSSILYTLNALSTFDANYQQGAGMRLAPGAVCWKIDGSDGFAVTKNGDTEYVNANILIHDTTDGSVRFYIGTWSIAWVDDGSGHDNIYGLFTITRYK